MSELIVEVAKKVRETKVVLNGVWCSFEKMNEVKLDNPIKREVQADDS